MNIEAYRSMIKENVVQSMKDFMEFAEDDCGFTLKDVEECEAILTRYLDALTSIDEVTDERIMTEVKTVVLELNDLNERTDYSIIETEEREAIWEIIQESAVECGLSDPEDDITEEWRDW